MNRKNHVVLEGNLTSDPRFQTYLKTDKDGNEKEIRVCNFTIACDGGRDGRSDEVYFANCECWDSAADRIAELTKGDCLHIEGILRNKKWTDKKTNLERNEVVVRVCHFIPVYVKDTVEV